MEAEQDTGRMVELESAVNRWLLNWNDHLDARKRTQVGSAPGFGSRTVYNEGWLTFLERNPKYKQTDDLMRHLTFVWLREYFGSLYGAIYTHILLNTNAEQHIHEMRQRAYTGRKNVLLMREIEMIDEAVEVIAWALDKMGHDPQVPGDDSDTTGLTPKQRKERVRQTFLRLKNRGLNDKNAVNRAAKECGVSVPRVYVHTRDMRDTSEEIAC